MVTFHKHLNRHFPSLEENNSQALNTELKVSSEITQEVRNSNICSSFQRSESVVFLSIGGPRLCFSLCIYSFKKHDAYNDLFFTQNGQLSQITGRGSKFNSFF